MIYARIYLRLEKAGRIFANTSNWFSSSDARLRTMCSRFGTFILASLFERKTIKELFYFSKSAIIVELDERRKLVPQNMNFVVSSSDKETRLFHLIEIDIYFNNSDHRRVFVSFVLHVANLSIREKWPKFFVQCWGTRRARFRVLWNRQFFEFCCNTFGTVSPTLFSTQKVRIPKNWKLEILFEII